MIKFNNQTTITLPYAHTKDLTEVFKNLARYKSKNNFLELSK